MGNQLASIAPSQIQPVEQYLQGHVFDIQPLRSTRFMKVVRAKIAPNVSIVVKVFVIPDLKLQTFVDGYKEANKLLTGKIIGESPDGKACLGLVGDCCLPFDYIIQDCNYSGRYLTRPFLAANLYDRLSTRPFLSAIERKFIAFQIIVAISRAHAKVVRHGDLKLENVLLTSWNWVQISDFAFFKPVYLLDNNPSSFNFYFDSSRRRTCNIAPERFVSEDHGAEFLDKHILVNTEKDKNISLSAKPEFDSAGNHRDLMLSMDIFSLGCVIGQLFTENHLFNLPQLLSYKTGSGYSPEHVINNIPDEGVRRLVWDMIKINPSDRKSADEYLLEYRGSVFPEYFYSFLYNYMRSYACPRSSDRNIVLLSEQYPQICENMKDELPVDLSNVTLILYPLVLSNLRSLKVCHSKLCALRLIEKMSGHMKSDSILTRVVPSVVLFFKDASSKVVCAGIWCLTQCLKNVSEVPRSQRKVFVEYIFPDLFQAVFSRSNQTENSKSTKFSSESVLHKFLQCFPSLVEMSQKFLDLSMVNNKECSQQLIPSEDTAANSTYMLDFSYDEELRCLRNTIGEFYLPLFSKATGVTKQLILESDLIKLCAFHENQPESDPLEQYLPTCASAANYWQLNESYFRNIVKVCAYSGDGFTKDMLPFIDQGLHNSEELVIVETLNTIKFLYKMNLIDVAKRLDFCAKFHPMLVHPNPWVRLNAAKALSEACTSVGPVIARASIYPKVNEYIINYSPNSRNVSPLPSTSNSPRSLQNAEQTYKLFKAKWGLTSIKDPSILLSHIQPMRRFSYEKICLFNYPVDQLLDYTFKLSLETNIENQSPADNFGAFEFPDNFTDDDKSLIQALYFEDRDSGKGYDAKPDLRKIGALREHVHARHHNLRHAVDTSMNQSDISLPEGTSVIVIKSDIPDPVAFQSQRYRNYESERQFCKIIRLPTGKNDKFSMHPSFLNCDSSKSKLNWDRLKLFGKDSASLCLVDSTSIENFACEVLGGAYYTDSPCLGYLKVLARFWKRTNQKRLEYLAKQREKAALYIVPPWRPVGSYVASLHDHTSAVNELVVSPNHNLFATCSKDGTCRVWNPVRWEINHQDPLNASGCVALKKGPVKSIAFLSNESIVACCHDSLQIIDVDRSPRSTEPKDNSCEAPWSMGLIRNVGSEEGAVVSMTNYDTIVTVSTNRNCVFGWDLRSPGQSNAYVFQTKPQEGLITSMVIAENGLCVVLGTSLGRFAVWDLRFLMPVKSFAPHVSTSSSKFKIPAVQKLKRHAFDREAIVASMRGHFEIAVWKLESGSRSKIFWSSPHNPLDYQTGANTYAMGFYVTGKCDGDLQIISGGSDKRVRLWDVANPSRSYVISNSIQPPGVEQTFSYNTNRVAISREYMHPYRGSSSSHSQTTESVSEFVDVIREKVTETNRQVMFRRGPDLPEFSHRDLVTDVNVVVGQSGTSYLVSADMSGVVKVWK